MSYGVVHVADTDLPDTDNPPPIRNARDAALALLAEGQVSAVVRQGDDVTTYVRDEDADARTMIRCWGDGQRLLHVAHAC